MFQVEAVINGKTVIGEQKDIQYDNIFILKKIFTNEKGGEKMEEKKSIKISLSTFFLIIAIIIIIIMGFIIYNLNNKQTISTVLKNEQDNKTTISESNKVESENLQTAETTNEITKSNEKNTIKHSYSYSDITGVYEWKDESELGVTLVLSEDGTFGYYFEVGGITGNYTIVDNTIILNEIFSHGGGVGLVVTKGEKKLTINNNNSITGDFSNKNYTYVPSSITMKKTKNSIDNTFDIREQIKSSLGTNLNNNILEFNY